MKLEVQVGFDRSGQVEAGPGPVPGKLGKAGGRAPRWEVESEVRAAWTMDIWEAEAKACAREMSQRSLAKRPVASTLLGAVEDTTSSPCCPNRQ